MIDKNLFYKRHDNTEKRLVRQGNFITICCGRMGFDIGLTEEVGRMTSKTCYIDFIPEITELLAGFSVEFGQTLPGICRIR